MLEIPSRRNYPGREGSVPIADQDALYRETVDTLGPSIDRLARAYEFDPEIRRDLLQDIHFHLWNSFGRFDGRCSLRTWVYRVAHNVATGHVLRQRRVRARLVAIEDIESVADAKQGEGAANQAQALDHLSRLIQRLKPLDRQIIVCYLEGMDAAATGEVTGLSPANVAMKIHRIKKLLKRWFGEVPVP